MAEFTKEIEGVEIKGLDGPITQIIDIPDEIEIQRRRKKRRAKRRPERESHVLTARVSWAEKEKIREKRKIQRAFNKSIEDQIEQRNERLKKERIFKKKLKEMNDERGLQFQLIKNSKKLKKLSKKAKRVVRKMPKAAFEKFLHK